METSDLMDRLKLMFYVFCVNSKSSQRALDELQRTIIEIETKYKAEISRLKKKYETEIREYEIQVETLTRTNAELAKNNKALSGRVKVGDIGYKNNYTSG